MIYHINVTVEDIRRGCRESEFACPIALAIRRATGRGVEVTPYSAHLYSQEYLVKVKVPLPDDARAFIRRFDGGAAVRPFSFELDVAPDIST